MSKGLRTNDNYIRHSRLGEMEDGTVEVLSTSNVKLHLDTFAILWKPVRCRNIGRTPSILWYLSCSVSHFSRLQLDCTCGNDAPTWKAL